MRVYFLLILFFVSTVSARSARNKRDTNETTLQPSTTETSNENTSDIIPHDSHCRNILITALKKFLQYIRPPLIAMNNMLCTFLKIINTSNNLMTYIIMEPIIKTIRMMFEMIKRTLAKII